MHCNGKEEVLRYNFQNFYDSSNIIEYEHLELQYSLPFWHPLYIYGYLIGFILSFVEFSFGKCLGYCSLIMVPLGYMKILIHLKKHDEKMSKIVKNVKKKRNVVSIGKTVQKLKLLH